MATVPAVGTLAVPGTTTTSVGMLAHAGVTRVIRQGPITIRGALAPPPISSGAQPVQELIMRLREEEKEVASLRGELQQARVEHEEMQDSRVFIAIHLLSLRTFRGFEVSQPFK